jgi:hypothetical protein
MELEAVPGAPQRDHHDRHPLRHLLVEARHGVGGVSFDVLLSDVAVHKPYAMAFCDGGYTANLTIEDLTRGKA